MLAVGDALALVVSQARGFTHDDFARFHPGGSLGRKLSRVMDVMRPIEACCVADDTQSLREIYVQSHRPKRRSGAILLVDGTGRLSGIFTDSDLARLFEHNRDRAIDRPIRDIMTATPITVQHDGLLIEAISILATRKISELPVVNSDHRPLGLIDITDVLPLLPREPQETGAAVDGPAGPPLDGKTVIARHDSAPKPPDAGHTPRRGNNNLAQGRADAALVPASAPPWASALSNLRLVFDYSSSPQYASSGCVRTSLSLSLPGSFVFARVSLRTPPPVPVGAG